MNKEDLVLSLFFNEPTKHWHFEEVLRAAGISRPQAARWLKIFFNGGLVKRTKPRGKLPYYLGNWQHPSYQSRKRVFALNYFEEQGFLRHLAGLPKAKVVILFGSLSRWDWHTDSDIDIFIFGDSTGFDRIKYRVNLGREIETFICKDKEELRKIPQSLMRNIAEGYLIKGTLDFLKVDYA